VFYYCVFVSIGSPGLNYQSVVYSLSTQDNAPLSRMLQAYRNHTKMPEAMLLHCRVITPDDYQELIKSGVSHFKLSLKPQLVKTEPQN
jgi:hypothetical protein